MAPSEQEKTTGNEEPAAAPSAATQKTSSSVIDSLTGQQKVAALLVAMGKPAAAKILKHFSPDDLRRLSGQAHTLPNISVADFDVLVHQFEDAFAEGVSFSQAGERFDNLVQETLPEDEAAAVLDPNATPALPEESLWEIMGKMTAEDLQQHLSLEHPQVIAYIISKLPSDLAAKLLLLQTMAERGDIIYRTLHLRTVLPIVDDILDKAMRPVLMQKNEAVDQSHYGEVANILNQLDKSEIDEMLASLDGLDPEDLEKIKSKLFVFEDIPRLSARARLLLFDDIPSDVIITALRNADQQTTETILSALSQRSRRMVEAELKSPNEMITQADITNARRQIAQQAIKLAGEGKISLAADETENAAEGEAKQADQGDAKGDEKESTAPKE
ncbi:flagellar motor switch protein FliG [uncultured Bartonella sp.]|uniref:flagellar motor switch protein FliG n=1 Tax=uncultured Bartonella sp. TaxID=104108 RepID=UPI0025F27B55|nr:flagellar motor switch protein FliG [uncultured Bartonella sp.]